MTIETRVGLRFARSDLKILSTLAHRAAAKEMPEAVGLFRNAAAAAATGEPLVVRCSNVVEAMMIADGFTQYGVQRPAIEQLSGLN